MPTMTAQMVAAEHEEAVTLREKIRASLAASKTRLAQLLKDLDENKAAFDSKKTQLGSFQIIRLSKQLLKDSFFTEKAKVKFADLAGTSDIATSNDGTLKKFEVFELFNI